MLNRSIRVALGAAVVALVGAAAAQTPATTQAPAKPLGAWKRTEGEASAEFKITADGLRLHLDLPPNTVEFEADYTVLKGNALYARVREMKQGGGPVTGDVFGFNYKIDGDSLELSDWKGSGATAVGVILQGTYARVK